MDVIVSCCDWTDVAQAESEISALKHAPDGTRFISVPVEPFSALNCSFHVRLMAETLSRDAVIMATADPRAPGVPREPVVIYFEQINMYLVCPNIGIPTLLLERYVPTKVVRLNYADWSSSVFNGRDIYAPTAGRILSGSLLEDLGEPFPVPSLYNLDIDHGTVVHIDNYGNLKLYASDDLSNIESVTVNGHRVSVVSNFMLASGELVPEGELVATNGSSFGLVEIQVKADGVGAIGAAEVLRVKVGDRLELSIT